MVPYVREMPHRSVTLCFPERGLNINSFMLVNAPRYSSHSRHLPVSPLWHTLRCQSRRPWFLFSISYGVSYETTS